VDPRRSAERTRAEKQLGFCSAAQSEGSLHVRRRPVLWGELLAGTSRDDIGFAATGPTDLMIVVLPNSIIRRWMQARRGANGMDPDLPPRHWAVSAATMMRRSHALSGLLDELLDQSEVKVTPGLLTRVESRISDTILDMIPSAEIVESLHSRARIARSVLQLLHDRYDDPPSVTEMCEQVGARERTLFLSCVEAFGRPPAQLLLELRLNAVHRMLVHPVKGASITGVASHYGSPISGDLRQCTFDGLVNCPRPLSRKRLGRTNAPMSATGPEVDMTMPVRKMLRSMV
jgi:AraC family transcriptional regulator, ethanolamine operon transcriptional activator